MLVGIQSEDFRKKYLSVIEAVQNFWELVKEKEDEVGGSLYEFLFSSHPQYQKFFKGDRAEQQRRIMKMFAKVAG